jgi:hypothetical membrane protein
MIRNVKLANRVILGVLVVLAVAGITTVMVDCLTDSTSVLLDLTTQIIFVLMFVALFIQSTIKRESLTKYISLAVIIIMLILMVVFVLKRVV